MEDFYTENYGTLKKYIEEHTGRWKDFPYLWVGRINIVKRALLPKVFYRFDAITFEILMILFTELKKTKKVLKFFWRIKDPE